MWMKIYITSILLDYVVCIVRICVHHVSDQVKDSIELLQLIGYELRSYQTYNTSAMNLEQGPSIPSVVEPVQYETTDHQVRIHVPVRRSASAAVAQ